MRIYKITNKSQRGVYTYTQTISEAIEACDNYIKGGTHSDDIDVEEVDVPKFTKGDDIYMLARLLEFHYDVFAHGDVLEPPYDELEEATHNNPSWASDDDCYYHLPTMQHIDEALCSGDYINVYDIEEHHLTRKVRYMGEWVTLGEAIQKYKKHTNPEKTKTLGIHVVGEEWLLPEN